WSPERNTDASGGGISSRLRCGSERVLRFDPSPATDGMFGHEGGRPVGFKADPEVAASAGGGTAGRRETAEGEPKQDGYASRRSDLTVAVEYLSALVRYGVSSCRRTGAV